MRTLIKLICFGVVLLKLGVITKATNNTADTNGTRDRKVKLTFTPGRITRLPTKSSISVCVNFTILDNNRYQLKIKEKIPQNTPQVAGLEGNDTFIISHNPENGDNSHNITFMVRGLFLGHTEFYISTELVRSKLEVNIIDIDLNTTYGVTPEGHREINNDEVVPMVTTFDISVVREVRILDTAFTVAINVLVIASYLSMGCKVEVPVIKEVLKKPIAPTIGFLSQYGFMPLIAFSVAKLLKIDNNLALGFFAMGVAPGGGMSNVYTYLLDGDLSLSVTMTLISTLASLGMIPFWIYTLGRQFVDEDQGVGIPFANIMITLAIIVIPTLVGMFISYKKPKWAKLISKIIKPLFIFVIIFAFSVGIYANLYIFSFFTFKIILAGCLLPYCGFIIGGLMGLVSRQPRNRILTIAMETGIQNTGVPVLMMRFSLMNPDSDLALIGPIAATIFTPIPLWIAIVVYEVYKRCCKKDTKEELDEDNNKVNVPNDYIRVTSIDSKASEPI
ncbi:unnamed protein product [Owenia fusiformis]|uniref:Uncharacterized protein n=1 Tax=Owenia fusiformis TaxID=6347 RepID=A0A8J1URU5_OWEFU|nr:unnamed protein product [Owenia fusiformis]